MARHQFAVIALAAVALSSSFWLLLDLVGAYTRGAQTFGVAFFEARFDALRKTIKPHTVFGYYSDNGNDATALAEFYLTQYTLAPAIVRPSLDEPLVVVNFHNPTPDPKLLQAKNLTAIQNFGNGVLLCHNDSR